MQHIIQILQKHCAAAEIQPMEMFGWLLELLRNSHHLHAFSGFAGGAAENKSNVFAEIMSNMNLLQRSVSGRAKPATNGRVKTSHFERE